MKQLANKFGSALQLSFSTWKKVNIEYNHSSYDRKFKRFLDILNDKYNNYMKEAHQNIRKKADTKLA